MEKLLYLKYADNPLLYRNSISALTSCLKLHQSEISEDGTFNNELKANIRKCTDDYIEIGAAASYGYTSFFQYKHTPNQAPVNEQEILKKMYARAASK